MDALFGNRPISLKALSDFSKIDQPTRAHLKKVYSCLAISMVTAGTGSAVHLFTDILKGNFLTFIGSLLMLILLAVTPQNDKNHKLRLGYLSGFTFFTGLGLGPLLDAVIQIDPSIVTTAFLATTLIFVCFTLSALWAEQRSYLYLGGTLMSGLMVLCFMGLTNLFFQSPFLHQVQLYGGLLVFCGFLLYDTQLIVEKCRRGDRDYIWHSVDLFLDFINIFRRLMIILAQNQKKKDRK